MGIWSCALLTNCPTAVVQKQWLTDGTSPCHRLEHVLSYKFDLETIPPTFTLQKFVEGVSDTAKVLGYLDEDECRAWDDLLHKILENNPGISHVQIHFYCSDFEHPYFFELVRGRCSMIYFLPSGHVFYSELLEDLGGEPFIQFIPDKYTQNYKDVHIEKSTPLLK
jgi:hypothetical protein